MPDFTPRVFRVPGCVEPEIRKALETIRDLLVAMKAGDEIQIDVNTVGGDTVTELHDASQLTGSLPAAVFNSNIYYEGTLGSDLSSGGTQTVGGKTINGKAIRSGYKIPSGAEFGALWNGTDYTLIWANECEAVA